MRSVEKNEFWGALLEKAYAKLHGSYKALEGGLTIEAAVDFTGGIPELIDLDRTEYSRERLFYIMTKADSQNAFMGCALTVSVIYVFVSKVGDPIQRFLNFLLRSPCPIQVSSSTS